MNENYNNFLTAFEVGVDDDIGEKREGTKDSESIFFVCSLFTSSSFYQCDLCLRGSDVVVCETITLVSVSERLVSRLREVVDDMRGGLGDESLSAFFAFIWFAQIFSPLWSSMDDKSVSKILSISSLSLHCVHILIHQ